MNVPFVDLKREYASIGGRVDKAIRNVLNSTQFILGQDLERFEDEFATYCQVKHGIGVGSGTAALHLGLLACGIRPGDEVITAANTFVATILAIIYTGAKPVLVDIDPETYNMAPDLLKEAITKKTKAVIPVHLYGQPADMGPIMKIAKKYGLIVIEDACQAHGAEYKGKKAGSFGIAACFSFYPAKNLGAFGDGGMVVTDRKDIADRIRLLRNYGQVRKYQYLIQGFNSRLDTLQAAILRAKLKNLDGQNRKRRKNAYLYKQLLKNSRYILPAEKKEMCHVYHLYVIRTKKRGKLQDYLKENGIYTGIHYQIPVHLTKAYSSLGYERGDFPITEKFAKQILSLPMFPDLKKGEIEYVADCLKRFPG